jgi:hypothetical protein
MGRNARTLAEHEFDKNKLAGRLEEVLLETVYGKQRILVDPERELMVSNVTAD